MDISSAIENIYRFDRARILATLVRQTRDLDMAEDVLQDAIARAIASWPDDGVPANPAGWISRTAQRIAIDNQRRIGAFRLRMPLLVIPEERDVSLHDVDLAFGDDRLRLIFTCCHPILAMESRLALTLRMICGLSTPDIASLFLVPEATMAARITRAKKKIGASGVPYVIPAPEHLEDRLQDVLAVIYLVATAGHTPGTGEGLYNTSHMELALDLSGVLHELIPNHPDVMGLRALILLTEARKASRIDAAGNALRLDQMDRSLWNSDLIAQAQCLTEQSLRISKPETVGRYALQAAIAMIHAEADSYERTDWAQIAALYAVLDHRHPSAIVRLGYGIAIGMRDTPQAGLEIINSSNLDVALAGYPMLPAARAELLRQAGDHAVAAVHYRLAADLTGNATLKSWFLTQAESMEPA